MSKATEKKLEKMSMEAAKQALVRERQERAKACEAEVQEVLQKHRCGMIVGHFQNSAGASEFTVGFSAQD